MPAARDSSLITGNVVIAAGSPALTDAALHISLEDVSYADGPATTVAAAVIRPVVHSGTDDTVIAFVLHPAPGTPAIDPRHHYAVQVWVDHDGDGRAGPGDLYNDQRHPVLTRGHPSTVRIMLGSG